MARTKSILTEAKQIERAVTLINLGARLQVLESETDLSYERLLRLYKEVSGKSPSKGQLPFSTDWFMTWQPNIHASLFLNIHEYLNKVAEIDEIDTVIKAYQLYQEQTTAQGLEALLSVTRAWRLVKFVDVGMVSQTRHVGYIAAYHATSPGYRNDSGFVPRTDFQRGFGNVSYRWWPEAAVVNWGPRVNYERGYDYAGTLTDEIRSATWNTLFSRNITVSATGSRNLERFRGVNFEKTRWSARATASCAT